jgi:DNA adenine methylase
MSENVSLQPFLKWAGGKRQLINHLRKYMPEDFDTYFEPFIGGGALFFDIKPQKAVINDINPEILNCYNVIREHTDELIADLSQHRNEKDYYYEMRELDRTQKYNELTPVQRASRIIYLNKTCYNGLFRVNSRGQFNVPFGRYKNPRYLNEPLLRAINQYLNRADVKILNVDFEEALNEAQKGDFVYLDPPYDPLSDTSSFTSYSSQSFNKTEQERLYRVFHDLDRRGCRVMLSNSATDFITELYGNYQIVIVPANRAINSVSSGRGKINEVLVLNYTISHKSVTNELLTCHCEEVVGQRHAFA